MRAAPRLAAACVVVVVAPFAAACSGGPATARPTSAGPSVSRWWSNSSVQIGSRIDPAHPAAAAGALHRSTVDYCAMLRSTVSAGRTILPGAGAGDPALATAAQAFVAEVQKVAPDEVAPSWRILGSAVLQLARSEGDLAKVHGVDQAALQRAATTVAAHAQRVCHVDVRR